MHLHHQVDTCDTCHDWPIWALHIIGNQHRIEQLMSEIITEQQHLDADIAGMTAAFATVIAELKAQVPAPGMALDFTGADAFLATVQGEAAADAPVVAPPVV